jgi:hypothetical protein
MEDDKKKLLETYRKLDPENRANVLSHALFAYTAQENTKKRLLRLLNGGDPLYADRNPAPMGAALAAEALNG